MASSTLLPSDSSRLPSYRSTHVARFHPYPRGGPRRGEDALMQTVDYRTADLTPGLPTIPEEPEPVRLCPLVICQDVQDGDVSFLELDEAVMGDTSVFEQGVTTEEEDNVGEKVKAAVMHLLVALRRRSLALLAVASFLWGERRMK